MHLVLVETGVLPCVHTADPGAVGHITFRISGSRALNKNDLLWDFSIGGSLDLSGSGPEAEFNLSKARPSITSGTSPYPYSPKLLQRDQIKTHRHNDGSDPFLHEPVLLLIVDGPTGQIFSQTLHFSPGKNDTWQD